MTSAKRRKPTCHPRRKMGNRGLCVPCYHAAWRSGRLADHPRVNRSMAEFLDDYKVLAGQGYNRYQIAERLGVCRDAVDKQISRARKRGLLDAVPA